MKSLFSMHILFLQRTAYKNITEVAISRNVSHLHAQTNPYFDAFASTSIHTGIFCVCAPSLGIYKMNTMIYDNESDTSSDCPFVEVVKSLHDH